MPAKRCDVCLTNFPANHPGAMCAICMEGELSVVFNAEPDDDWETNLRHAQFERYYEQTRGHEADDDAAAARRKLLAQDD